MNCKKETVQQIQRILTEGGVPIVINKRNIHERGYTNEVAEEIVARFKIARSMHIGHEKNYSTEEIFTPSILKDISRCYENDLSDESLKEFSEKYSISNFKLQRKIRKAFLLTESAKKGECCLCHLPVARVTLDKKTDHANNEKDQTSFHVFGYYHGVPVLFTVDHIIARSNGGEDVPENFQLMCEICNVKKGTNDAV